MKRRLLAGLLGLFASATVLADEELFAFALIGDLPYSRFERTWFADYLARVAADEVAFVIHAGDFKSGGEPCSDALYADRRALFDASPVPFVLVPGDNDWSDCNRLTAGRYDPLERLQALRRVFYPPGESLGQTRMAVLSQADAPHRQRTRENLRWQRGPVTFATLNIVGPDNARGRKREPPAEFVARNAANLAWLDAAFEAAAKARSKALVLVMQADPQFADFNRGKPRPGFADFLQRLREASIAFSGEVLLVHGDGHWHEIDKPLEDRAGRTLRNFTRIETYGSPFMGWVRVGVHEGPSRTLRFRSRVYSPEFSGRRVSP